MYLLMKLLHIVATGIATAIIGGLPLLLAALPSMVPGSAP